MLDAHDDDQRPKDKRQDAIDIRFRQRDGMIAVKAFLEVVEGACSDVAKTTPRAPTTSVRVVFLKEWGLGSGSEGGKLSLLKNGCGIFYLKSSWLRFF